MRQIEIEWVALGITVSAELTGRNPGLEDLLWDRLLPYNSLQNHALVSGDHLYHLVPHPELIYTDADYKEDRTQSPHGTVFLSQLQHLAVKYGPLSEYLPAAPVARVLEEDMTLLRRAGQACWDAAWETKQPIEVRVRRAGDSRTRHLLPRGPRVDVIDVQKVIDEIYDETQQVWINPPAEIVDIYQGQILSRAGSREQYFSTLVFVNGEARPLGYCALNGLVKICATTDTPLGTLKNITPTFIKVPAEFLGYTGLNRLWRFTQQVLDVLPKVSTKEQYFALISGLALYTNVLNTWNLHLFPWKHGDEYRYPIAGTPRENELGVMSHGTLGRTVESNSYQAAICIERKSKATYIGLMMTAPHASDRGTASPRRLYGKLLLYVDTASNLVWHASSGG